MKRIVDVFLARGERDLEAVEGAVRTAVLGMGAQSLGEFMTAVGLTEPSQPVCCAK